MIGLPRIIAGVIGVVVVAGAAAGFAVAWRPAIAAIEPPAPASFETALVKRGRELAAIGNCNDCHTVKGGGSFAGGLPVPTPFGTIYSSNITPDAQTGIGRWSEDAFRRAMRSGVNRDGQHLYPTFPYDHFTNVSDQDDAALYAFLMTRPPVNAPARVNELSFPLDQRFVIAGWKLLFLRRGSTDYGALDEVAPVELWLFHGFFPLPPKSTLEDMPFFGTMLLLVEPGKARFWTTRDLQWHRLCDAGTRGHRTLASRVNRR